MASPKRKADRSLVITDVRKRNKSSIESIISMAELMIERNYPEHRFLDQVSKLRKMVENKQDTMVLLLEAKFYLARGHNREVRRRINECFRLNRLDVNTRLFTIRWRLKSADREKDLIVKKDHLVWALKECVSLLKVEPALLSACYLKGLTHHQLVQYDEAVTEFDKCLKDEVYGLKSVWQAYNSLMCMIRLKLKTDTEKKNSFFKASQYLDRVLLMSEIERDKKMVKENQAWIKEKLDGMAKDQEKVKEKEVVTEKESFTEKPKEKDGLIDKPKEKEKEKPKESVTDKPKDQHKEKEKDILDQMATMGPVYQCYAASMVEQQMNQSAILEVLNMKAEDCDALLMGSLGFTKFNCIVFRNRFSPK